MSIDRQMGRETSAARNFASRAIDSANKWRDQYNPLRGITIARAVGLLEAGQRGDYSELQWLYQHIEKTDGDLSCCIERRSAALIQLDWSCKLVSSKKTSAFDKKLAADQQAFLTAVYNQFENLYEAIEHLALASFRGFSHLQVQANHFEILDQWNLTRQANAWYWNPEAKSCLTSAPDEDRRIELERDRVLVRTNPRPVNEIALIKFVRQNLSLKDWDAFLEIYGLPGWIVIMPPNIPAGKERDYEFAARDVAEGASGALPAGSDVRCSDQPRGINPFKEHLGYLTEKLILAATGGLLTVLSAPGSGTLAGSAHMEAFKTIARGEARKISEIFQKQLDKRLLAEQFPGRPVLAYFELAANQETNVAAIVNHALQLSQAGFHMDPAQLSEKTGYRLTRWGQME